MKFLIIAVFALALLADACRAANCDHPKDVDGGVLSSEPPSVSTESSRVKQFFKRVQSTIEKAEPFVEQLEREAIRLEETAKRLGETVIHRLGDLVDRIIGAPHGGGGAASTTISPSLVAPVTIEAEVLEVTDEHKLDQAPQAESDNESSSSTSTITTENPSKSDVSNAIDKDDKDKYNLDNDIFGDDKCPEGFVLDVNGICQRIS